MPDTRLQRTREVYRPSPMADMTSLHLYTVDEVMSIAHWNEDCPALPALGGDIRQAYEPVGYHRCLICMPRRKGSTRWCDQW
jgi:hypothetical protein